MARPPDSDPQQGVATLRIDRWLWHARFFRSRALACEAVAGGRVHVNGERVKPSRALRCGDMLSVVRGELEVECRVLALPVRRGPAAEASRAYQETPESRDRRARAAEARRFAATAPRPEGRPDKHERRALRRVRGRAP